MPSRRCGRKWPSCVARSGNREPRREHGWNATSNKSLCGGGAGPAAAATAPLPGHRGRRRAAPAAAAKIIYGRAAERAQSVWLAAGSVSAASVGSSIRQEAAHVEPYGLDIIRKPIDHHLNADNSWCGQTTGRHKPLARTAAFGGSTADRNADAIRSGLGERYFSTSQNRVGQ